MHILSVVILPEAERASNTVIPGVGAIGSRIKSDGLAGGRQRKKQLQQMSRNISMEVPFRSVFQTCISPHSILVFQLKFILSELRKVTKNKNWKVSVENLNFIVKDCFILGVYHGRLPLFDINKLCSRSNRWWAGSLIWNTISYISWVDRRCITVENCRYAVARKEGSSADR